MVAKSWPRNSRLTRQARLRDDFSRPEPEPEEVLDIVSINDSDSEGIQDSQSLPVNSSDSKADSFTMPPSTSQSRQGRSAANSSRATSTSNATKKTKKPPPDPIEISTDGSVNQDEDEDMLDFEDVQVPTDRAAEGEGDSEDLEMEDVEPDAGAADGSMRDVNDMYAAAYREAQAMPMEGDDDDEDGEGDDDAGDSSRASTSAIPIFKDGKGQHKGVEISMGTQNKKQDSGAVRKKSNNILTPRDRQNRIKAHKLYVLSILAHAQVRNKWCNDAALRDKLADDVPEYMINKLRSIHPKKVTEQRERIRMFESFLSELVRWWVNRFRLDPHLTAKSALRQPDQDIATGILPASGRRIDGWIVESAAERDERHRRERKAQLRNQKARQEQAQRAVKGKAKASATDDAIEGAAPAKTMEITIFAPGSAIRPVYLRLLPSAESISSAADLLERAHERSGSRETSAQLFCALCRSLGIPARLVISPQPMPWSVGASKLANTAQPGSQLEKKPNKLRSKTKGGGTKYNARPIDEFTSDEDSDLGASERERAQQTQTKAPRKRATAQSASSVLSNDSSDLSDIEEVTPSSPKNPTSSKGANLAKKAVLSSASSRTRRQAANGVSPSTSTAGKRGEPIEVDGTTSDSSVHSGASQPNQTKAAARGKGTANAKGKGKARARTTDDDGSSQVDADETDYRPEKWKNLKTPLKIEPKVKLRAFRPKQLKATEMAAYDDDTADPVDLQAPPTMWVEVFSKPYQKWISVDPIRSLVRPTGNRLMEPSTTDRQNKLVYVVAFEEDGYARDVTARYTKTLNSRVSRLRPPARAKGEEEWWSKVARAIHRPQRLDRDAMEDAELEDNSSREPMPTSVAGFKDHPLYFLEKNMKRDEVVFPRRQIATFQGMPVFSRSDVLTLRSSRQWYNEGRVVKDGEVALKFVKSRGYTLANKRAEEQARLEGREVAQEGLYAEFQTTLFVPPPVGPDGKIPTNGFGNIDLFVPSMLPAGAVHLPYSGIAKVAKKLGVPYAEAITGFEFRKQRGMPKITGIVVAQQNGEMVEEAFWQQEHEDAVKQQTKQMERAMKNWRKLINSLRIAKRVQEQYGDKLAAAKGGNKKAAVPGKSKKRDTTPPSSPTKSKYFSPKKATADDEGDATRADPKSDRRSPQNAAPMDLEGSVEDLSVPVQEDAAAEEDSTDPRLATEPSSADTVRNGVKRKIISMAQLASQASKTGKSANRQDEDDDSASTSASEHDDEPDEPLVTATEDAAEEKASLITDEAEEDMRGSKRRRTARIPSAPATPSVPNGRPRRTPSKKQAVPSPAAETPSRSTRTRASTRSTRARKSYAEASDSDPELLAQDNDKPSPETATATAAPAPAPASVVPTATPPAARKIRIRVPKSIPRHH
ncbi:Rad4-domain-containing protein [Testicularia cyperi]|uniref:Rad4-domain-containing protein n=1 Tax=Testicularia cyperi TaxID=1882483 RepID=A0A317XLJ5_9BASI|nr:Rad4-domain-containing protein [Testicularia cyperi]